MLGDYTLVIAETERAEEQVDTALEPVALCKYLVVLISGIRKLNCLCAGLPLSPEKPHNSDERPNQEDAVERWGIRSHVCSSGTIESSLRFLMYDRVCIHTILWDRPLAAYMIDNGHEENRKP